MSATDAFNAPVEDRGHTFARLLMDDYAQLENTVRQRAVARAKVLLDECGIKGQDRFVALARVEQQEVSIYDVDALLNCHDGAKRALALALRRAGTDAAQVDPIVSKYDIISAIDLARELVGFKVREKPKTESNADPNVQGATQTSGTSSGDTSPSVVSTPA
jgi:hypothetical protein